MDFDDGITSDQPGPSQTSDDLFGRRQQRHAESPSASRDLCKRQKLAVHVRYDIARRGQSTNGRRQT